MDQSRARGAFPVRYRTFLQRLLESGLLRLRYQCEIGVGEEAALSRLLPPHADAATRVSSHASIAAASLPKGPLEPDIGERAIASLCGDISRDICKGQ